MKWHPDTLHIALKIARNLKVKPKFTQQRLLNRIWKACDKYLKAIKGEGTVGR